MKNIIVAILVWTVCIAACGCGKKPLPEDRVLARISNKAITLKEFKARIDKLPIYYRNIVDKDKKKYLDETIMEMLLYEEAVRRGLDRDREVRDVIKEAGKKIIIAKLIRDDVENKVTISEEEARRFYDEHKDEFKTPELHRASHILVPTEREARDVLDELSKGASFEELARAHSTDATASRGGDVGYFRLGQVAPDFEKACLELKPGEVSDIVHTQFGYHIIKLTDKKEPSIESFEKVKNAIETELRNKKRSELFDKLVLTLKEKYAVDIKEDVLQALDGAKDKAQGAAEK